MTYGLDQGLQWFHYASVVAELAEWLHDQGRFDSVEDVMGFIRRPWRYENEYQQYRDSRMSGAGVYKTELSSEETDVDELKVKQKGAASGQQ